MQVRFHLDESVHLGVADGLIRRGIDVSVSRDAGLIGSGDIQQLEYARANGRVLVTHDSDFLALVSGETHHCGVVFCHNQTRSVGQIIRALERLTISHDAESFLGVVEFI